MIYTEGWMGKWVGADWGWESSSSCCPLGTRDGAQGPLGSGDPQHLPEVVWLPLPLVLRIRRAPHSWNPFQDPRAPCAPNPEAPMVPESPLSCWGDGSPHFRSPPTPGREGREGEVGSEGGRAREMRARRSSADGEAKATLELVLSVIQEGP